MSKKYGYGTLIHFHSSDEMARRCLCTNFGQTMKSPDEKRDLKNCDTEEKWLQSNPSPRGMRIYNDVKNWNPGA